MTMTAVSVALPGPPFVSTVGSVKTWSAPMTATTVANSMVGLSRGRVMAHRRRQPVAPSTSAASMSSGEMPARPPVNSRNVKPICCQTEVSTTVIMAQPGVSSQGTGPTPIRLR